MDKTTAALLGGVATLALTQGGVAKAAPATYAEAMQASSYSDLLSPIPNARTLLADAPQEAEQPQVMRVQYYDHHHHHHHHHWRHRRHWRRYLPPPPPVVILHHHHHHHHHHNQQMP